MKNIIKKHNKFPGVNELNEINELSCFVLANIRLHRYNSFVRFILLFFNDINVNLDLMTEQTFFKYSPIS